jgi:hypothetical protein
MKNIVENLVSFVKRNDVDNIDKIDEQVAQLSQEQIKELTDLLDNKISTINNQEWAEYLTEINNDYKNLLNNNEEETNMKTNYLQCVVVENGDTKTAERIYDEIFVGLFANNASRVAEVIDNRIYFNLNVLDEDNSLFVNLALRTRIEMYENVNIYNWNEEKQDYIQIVNEDNAKLSKLPSVKNLNYFDKIVSASLEERFNLLFIEETGITEDQLAVISFENSLEYIMINLSEDQKVELDAKFKEFLKTRRSEKKQAKTDAKLDAAGEKIIRTTKKVAKASAKLTEATITAVSEGTTEFVNEFRIARANRSNRRKLENNNNYKLNRAKQLEQQQVIEAAQSVIAKVQTVKYIYKAITNTTDEETTNSRIAD